MLQGCRTPDGGLINVEYYSVFSELCNEQGFLWLSQIWLNHDSKMRVGTIADNRVYKGIGPWFIAMKVRVLRRKKRGTLYERNKHSSK